MKPAIMTAQTSDTITRQVARFIGGLSPSSIPEDIEEKARNCILYGFGIGLMCLNQETARTADRAVFIIDGEAGARGATSLFSGQRVSVTSAVFANAVLLHSRCQEDTSGTAHIGVVVLSVALALVEAGLADAGDFIPGIVAGYEVAGTLEAALGRDTMNASHRASPLYGTIASAATAARMLRLPEERIDAALANAAQITGGTLQSIPEGSDEWRYQVGAAARHGLLAAMLAHAGSFSASHSIEGAQGFVQAFARRDLRAGELDFSTQRAWRLRDVTFKPYPVCAHNQTVGMIGAQVHSRYKPEQIEHLKLRISSYVVPGLLARGPFARVPDTLMSAAFCCACACVEGTISMTGLEKFNDPAILAMMERIVVEPDPTVIYPAATAELTLRDGTRADLFERRKFTDFNLGRNDVNAQLLRLGNEEKVPAQAVALLDSFAFSNGLGANHELIAQAFALARVA